MQVVEMNELIRARMLRGVLSMFLLSIVGMPSATPQENPPVRQVTMLTFVHDFLQVFYPELISKGHTLTFAVHGPADDSWSELAGAYFTVKPERPPDYGLVRLGPNGLIPETRPDPEKVLLDGSIWLPPLEHGSRIQEVHATCEGATKLAALRKLVELHPEWSNDQAVNALKRQGARFGPDNKKAFVSTLPFDKTERFLGRLTITSVQFNHLEERREGNFAASTLDWTVSADALFSDGTKAKYVFGFEPYEGKLTLLVRID
jgi:hypothetical protein